MFPLPRAMGNVANVLAGPADPNPPLVGAISGTARLAPRDVVGQLDTSSGDTTSGAFRIINVAATASFTFPFGTQYDIIAEDLGYSGPSAGSNYGDWYADAFLNPTINTIGSLANQTRFISNDATFFGGSALPSSGTVSPWVSPTAPVVGSFTVVPGSIIELGNLRHVMTGAANQLSPDATSRPLLMILPRTRPTTGNITLVSVSNYPLNLAAVKLTVNGVTFNLSQPGLSPPVVTAPIVTMTIPVGFAGFLPPPGTPARLRLTAVEAGPAPAGITFRTGINEVQY